MLGLGDPEHNTRIIMEREAERPMRDIPELKLWGIWNQLKEQLDENEERRENRRASFL